MIGHPRYTKEEVAERAEALYEAIRPSVERQHHAEYLVIDIESGDYEIDKDRIVASDRAYAKHPDGALYGLRIGYPSMGRMGFRLGKL